jgi:hypothetical protein
MDDVDPELEYVDETKNRRKCFGRFASDFLQQFASFPFGL